MFSDSDGVVDADTEPKSSANIVITFFTFLHLFLPCRFFYFLLFTFPQLFTYLYVNRYRERMLRGL
jgi:hypothetical protein